MAKKKSKSAKTSAPSKTAPAKSRSKPAAKKPAGKPAHEHHAHEHFDDEHCEEDHGDEIEIELDDTEQKMVDMVLKSVKLQQALEDEVSTAVSATVRKFCRNHGTPLSAAQAQNVAMVLFND